MKWSLPFVDACLLGGSFWSFLHFEAAMLEFISVIVVGPAYQYIGHAWLSNTWECKSIHFHESNPNHPQPNLLPKLWHKCEIQFVLNYVTFLLVLWEELGSEIELCPCLTKDDNTRTWVHILICDNHLLAPNCSYHCDQRHEGGNNVGGHLMP